MPALSYLNHLIPCGRCGGVRTPRTWFSLVVSFPSCVLPVWSLREIYLICSVVHCIFRVSNYGVIGKRGALFFGDEKTKSYLWKWQSRQALFWAYQYAFIHLTHNTYKALPSSGWFLVFWERDPHSPGWVTTEPLPHPPHSHTIKVNKVLAGCDGTYLQTQHRRGRKRWISVSSRPACST